MRSKQASLGYLRSDFKRGQSDGPSDVPKGGWWTVVGASGEVVVGAYGEELDAWFGSSTEASGPAQVVDHLNRPTDVRAFMWGKVIPTICIRCNTINEYTGVEHVTIVAESEVPPNHRGQTERGLAGVYICRSCK